MWDVVLMSVAIFVARIADVSLSTVRTVLVVQGAKLLAWVFGFVEVLIWILVVAKVIQNLEDPIYAVMYALGAATGSYVGVLIEQRMAYGKVIVRIFTRYGEAVAAALRDAGYRVTEIEGKGKDGPVDLLFVGVPRRRAHAVTRLALSVDPRCFYIHDDIRYESSADVRVARPLPSSRPRWATPRWRRSMVARK